MKYSHREDDGVMGYHATTLAPPIKAPSAAAWLPSTRAFPSTLPVIASRRQGSSLEKLSFRRDPQLVPRGEAFNVGGKDVFGRYRDSHMEDRSGQNQVCGLAARTVDGGGLDGEVVDDWFGHFDFGLADYGFYAGAGGTLDSLESSSREGGGSQGDRAGRAPRGDCPGHRQDAHRGRPRGERRGRSRGGRLPHRQAIRGRRG